MTDVSDSTGWDVRRVLSISAVVLVALALALGAAFVGAPRGTSIEDPAAYVRSFYEEGDVRGLLAALAPGSIADDQLAQAEQDLHQILRPEVQVVGTQELELDGRTITQVQTSDQLVWCVDDNGTLYVRCRVGEAPVEIVAGDTPVRGTLSQADVFPDRVELIVGLQATGDQPLTLGGVELQGAGDGVELVQTVGSVGGQLAAVDVEQFELRQDNELFLAWSGPRDALLGRDLTLQWDGGSVGLEVGTVDYLFPGQG